MKDLGGVPSTETGAAVARHPQAILVSGQAGFAEGQSRRLPLGGLDETEVVALLTRLGQRPDGPQDEVPG